MLLFPGACSVEESEPRACLRPRIEMPGGGFAEAVRLYRSRCAACHGVTGEGDGPTGDGLARAPRDFRRQRFRFVSTENGVASLDDLARSIERGILPAGMPHGRDLTPTARRALAAYVLEIQRLGVQEELRGRWFSRSDLEDRACAEIAGRATRGGRQVAVPPRPARTDSAVGQRAYEEHCAVCHGLDGRGARSVSLTDDLGRPLAPPPFEAGQFLGGEGDEDLYWRVRCGLPGTAMPAFASAAIDDELIWDVIEHVRALARAGPVPGGG
jgi:mono/diheme cytochrome c family protein